jgi:tetratricopeptide (TPR) repeat protein
MFVRALATAWSDDVPVPVTVADPAVERWVAGLLGAGPDEVIQAVVASSDDFVMAAVRLLLARAREAAVSRLEGEPDPPFANAAELLQIMVSRGHGTGFEGGELTEPHAHFLIGLKYHLVAPDTAHRAYELARYAYVNARADRLARLAALASSTVKRALLASGDTTEVRERLEQLAEVDAATATTLEQAFQVYEGVVVWIAKSGSDTSELAPERVDAEGVELLGAAALAASDDLSLAVRIAGVADAARSRNDEAAPTSLSHLAGGLVMQRRWADAIALLTDLHARDPVDQQIAYRLARAYAELDRWPEAKAVLLGLLNDPPTLEDVPTLWWLASLALGAHDPDAGRWRQELLELDPDSDPLAGMPRGVDDHEERPRLLTAFRDGTLEVDAALFELPQQDMTAQTMAAIVAGVPDGREMLDRLLEEDPQLAEKVMALLGIRRLTAEEAKAEEHFQAAEQHFAARRFDGAQREYEAVLRLDPDHLMATVYLGDVWYRRGAYHIAQAYFEESLEIEPTAIAYRFLGDAILHGGHGSRRARECFKRALELDPDYRGAREALADLDARSGVELSGEEVAPPTDGPREEPSPPSLPTVPPALTDLPVSDTPPSERVRALESSGRTGDRLVAALLRASDGEGFVAVADDDERFAQWLSQATSAELVGAGEIAVMLGFHYHLKDRDVRQWKHWVSRQLAVAEALPVGFGPADSPIEELGRDRLLADALCALAEVREDERRLPEARLLCERALELLAAEDKARAAAGLVGESQHDQLFMWRSVRATTLSRLSKICARLGDDAAAAEYEREAMRLDEERPTSEIQVEGFIRGGDIATYEGDTDAALGAYQHALHLAEDEDPDPLVPRMLTRALNALGQAYYRLGTPRTALACFDRARRLNENTGNADRLTHDHHWIARVLRDRPDLGTDGLADAREHLERALTYASAPGGDLGDLEWTGSDRIPLRITAPDRAWPILLELGKLLQEQGEDLRAAQFLTLATRLSELVRASLVEEAQRVEVQNEQIEAFAELTKVYVRLATRGGDDDVCHARAAWLTNESMRARTFLDVLGDAELSVPAGVPADLLESERDLLARRRALRRSGRNDAAFWGEYREVIDELEALWQHMRALRPEAEGYVEVRQARPAELDDVAALLKVDGRRVVLASVIQLGGGALGVLALRGDHDGPVIETRAVDIARLTRFVRQNFGSAGRVRELAVDMEDLFQHELAAVADLLTSVTQPEETLVVCPVGVLHHVPLGALRRRDELLLERNPIALLPSASILRALRVATHQPASMPAAVFGDPTGDLPGARSEAVVIAERFATRAALGHEASIAAVRRALAEADLLHVAGHARFDPADALASGLVLADGTLTAREIIATEAPALLLVALSACETGVIENDAAEELVGLTRALLFAGADSVVVSLWKVPDLPTLDVMGGFYDAIADGTAKVDALRAAVLAARERHGLNRIDRWAGFQLVGDWR